jgi:hypothetical protein
VIGQFGRAGGGKDGRRLGRRRRAALLVNGGRLLGGGSRGVAGQGIQEGAQQFRLERLGEHLAGGAGRDVLLHGGGFGRCQAADAPREQAVGGGVGGTAGHGGVPSGGAEPRITRASGIITSLFGRGE